MFASTCELYLCSIRFYPTPVSAFGYCRCLRVYVRMSLCKNKSRLRSLLFCGFIDLELQGQYKKSKFTPFYACPREKSPLMEARTPNSHKRCKPIWLRSLLCWGLIGIDNVKFNLNIEMKAWVWTPNNSFNHLDCPDCFTNPNGSPSHTSAHTVFFYCLPPYTDHDRRWYSGG